MDHKTFSDTVTLKSYLTGFIVSLVLILAAYFAVTAGTLSQGLLIGIIFALAIIQVFVQLRCFLHIGLRSQSRVQLVILIFTAIGIGILVSGSLWIMYHLNYSMTSSDMTSIIMQEEGMKM